MKFWEASTAFVGKLNERIDKVLSVVAMKDRAHDKVEEYSGGMKRRINIAVALLSSNHPNNG